jgi:hypothetical protein
MEGLLINCTLHVQSGLVLERCEINMSAVSTVSLHSLIKDRKLILPSLCEQDKQDQQDAQFSY